MNPGSKPTLNDAPSTDPAVEETQSTGPLGALAIMSATCVVLGVFQAALWLVVPLILSLVLYYLLRPAYFRLMGAGMRAGLGAGALVVGFSVGTVALLVELSPWVRALVMDNGGALERLRLGGLQLLDQVIAAVDALLASFASVHMREEVREELGRAIPAVAASLGRIVEPSMTAMSRWVPAMILVPFITFFLLKDGRQLKILLARPVPNAFFESSLVLLHRVDEAAKSYFRGLFQLTIIDAAALSLGLAVIGLPYAVLLGAASAVLMWIPYVGGIIATVGACIVAATQFPGQPLILYSTLAWYLVVRWLDGFVFMPMTIGKDLHIHPVAAVLTIVLAGTIAGIPGMMLALPVYGILKVVFDSSSLVLLDARLQARYRHERMLRRRQAASGLMP